ncbi:uncharacterized protein LKV04_021511 [Tautogolabrus adspersus]
MTHVLQNWQTEHELHATLEKLLQDKKYLAAFRAFLQSEFSEENIEFWLACEDFRSTTSSGDLHWKAEKIYKEFIEPTACREINVDFHIKEKIKKSLEKPSLSSFDEAQRHVYLLMERDSWPRFLHSDAYLSLKHKSRTLCTYNRVWAKKESSISEAKPKEFGLNKTMPSLIVEPLNTEQFIMDRDDRKRNKNIGKNFMCRLQGMFSHSSSSESRLTLEDTQQWSQSLERLLESKYGLATFRNFLKSEYSDENIEFWLTCEDYKKIKSSFRMSSRAKKIYEQFVKAESPKEINIDYHTREQIKRSVKSPNLHCFDEAQKMVYGLMERDSYPRFLRSDIYRTLLENLAADAAKG